ncbi:MAG: tetratricopeptide repeat protein [Woeseiaceae bacterium]
MRKSGTRIRITAQLIRADSGFHLWSESYERELKDIFEIQDEIAAKILHALKTQLVDSQPAAIESERTDPEVYERYLLAKQRLYMRTTPAIESALELLDEAIAIDADYAPAQAQRAIATLLLSENNYGTMPSADARRAALRYVERALELDPDHAEAWASLGLYHNNAPGEQGEAIEALSQALAINPNLIDARNWLQIGLQNTGDMRGSLEVLADLAERDPLYKPGFGNGVLTFTVFGMTDESQALIDRYRRFDPSDPMLLYADAMQHYALGKSAEGYRLAARASELAPTDAVVNFVYAIGLLQTQMVEKLAAEGRIGMQVDALDWLGRRDEAFTAARELAGQGLPLNLFRLLNRAGRHREVIDYVNERWPSLDAFAADTPRGVFGFDEMLELAVAYVRTGDNERFDEAMGHLERVMTSLEEAGVDHFVFDRGMADYLALRGEHDAAIGRLRVAVDRGLKAWPDLAINLSGMYELRDDPRLLELDELMVGNINEQRAMLDLGPIEARNGAWR